MYYTEEYLETTNKEKVRIRINNNIDRINVIYIHGLGERLEHCEFLYDAFEASNIALSMVELRGHGLSDGKAKYIENFEQYVEDLKNLIDSKFGNKEFFLFGHSTGALIESLFCQMYENKYPVKGLIFTSPLFKLNSNLLIEFLISILSKISPGFAFKAKEESFYKLTHDKENAKILLDESKRTLMGVTVGFINAFFKARKKIIKNYDKLFHIPIFIYLSSQDIIVDAEFINEEISQIFKESTKLHLEMLDECFHSILLEAKRNDYIDGIIDWIKSNS